MNRMNNFRLKGNNKDQWEQLIFSLEEREKPTLIVIGSDSYSIQKKLYKELESVFIQYNFFKLDLSAQSIESLNYAFVNNLPEIILNSKSVEYIVNVFGLENSLFRIKNNQIESTSLIPALNFEREILFQRYPFVIIIWTDSYTINTLKKEAKDLWDWISYHFEFETDNVDQFKSSIPNSPPLVHGDLNPKNILVDRSIDSHRVFISYARDDYETASRLYHDLIKAGFHPWLDKKNLRAGENWKWAISRAIKASSYFLALLSSNSLGMRGYVHKELKIALDIFDEFPSNETYIIPVYIEPCRPFDERLQDILGVNLYESYERGLKQILRALSYYEKDEKNYDLEFYPINEIQKYEIANRIKTLQEKYDTINLNDPLRKRVIKEKINIQKLLGQEYMKIRNYGKAEQCFRIALSLTQHMDGLEGEKDEISFLLNQVFYQP